MKLTEFNILPVHERATQLSVCCGSEKWQKTVAESAPFDSLSAMANVAENVWYTECYEAEWLEAFRHHPKIGDVQSLKEKFALTQHLASNEQQSVSTASDEIIQALADANTAYETKFGFIFIVCATGKSAEEMLRLLKDRLRNTYFEELNIAMGEQHKITLLRLQKLFSDEPLQLKPGHITTHILDTSIGKPGKNITIQLKRPYENGWQIIAQGVTNADGRIPDLLPAGRCIAPGNYKMVFDTASYFLLQKIQGFYPEVEIQFTVFDNSHYHVPLLINPFGYSTYRGS